MAAPAPRSLAVSTNPAIDRVARLGGPAAGVVKAAEFLETPGGKAAHVAMVATALGGEVELLTTAGGRSGGLFLALLEHEGFPVHAVRVSGATRGTYTVVVDGEADVVEVHEPAGELSAADADALVAALAAIAGNFETVAICGSLPPGAPIDLHARLVAAAREAGARTILDCSTVPAFEAALEARPDLVAPNLAEARALMGRKLDHMSSFRPTDTEPGPTDEELYALCDGLMAAGAAAVWLSLGADGSLFARPGAGFRMRARSSPEVVNAVGCGDALVGGLLAGGNDWAGAAALGVAAATDKLAHLHPGRVDPWRVRTIMGELEIVPLRKAAA
jgi:1-phosphofructokinase family hexose kinase